MDDKLYKLDKTPEDINQLMQRHKNLVYKILADFGYKNSHEYESAGMEALWTAIVTFDVFAKTAFSTYAYKCIVNAMNNVYRVDMRRRQHYICLDCTNNELEPLEVDVALKVESDEAAQKLLGYVRDYLNTLDKDTYGYKAIQLWYSTQFTLTPSNIAKAIGTSTSIVSRAQQLLRAYLSRRIYEARKEDKSE